MKILLDAHTLIWFTEGDAKLSFNAKTEIAKDENQRFISIASLWEIVIKTSIGKLELNQSIIDVKTVLDVNNISLLGINFNHLSILLNLPQHHKDPFDRLIISQAISENLTIISSDQHFSAYPVPVIW
ncbi:type II toxin-antitoxin system VapC family toxin [Mucilaginibacter terrigena]|uniref:Type II toxin-antitoxin system VapC family toxin n=1 Tax=Mucilaginibacter terrigena TaxID=2492395 RepID=A0A4Q5LGP2_9SPHI|nr:type II toxin-antitoxin system VapC family toxin [Mucilaginibacter terrigena]RYU85877.1 type II toxin-antitoxin system VapC family toxin [Mucilaginibacter terrigena]